MASGEHTGAFTSGDNHGRNHPYTAEGQGNTAATSNSCYPRFAGWVGDGNHRISDSKMTPLESGSDASSSPASSWHIITDVSNSGGSVLEEDDTEDNLSSTSDSGYVHLSSAHLHPRASPSRPQTSNTSFTQDLPSSPPGSVAFDVQHRVGAVAPSNVQFSRAQWGSVYADGGSFVCNQQPHHGYNNGFCIPMSYTHVERTPLSAGQTYSGIASSAVASSMNAQTCNAPLPHQAGLGYDQYGLAPNIYGPSDLHGQQQQYTHMFAPQPKLCDILDNGFLPQLTISSMDSLLVQPRLSSLPVAPMVEQAQTSAQPMPTVPRVARRSVPSVPSHRSSQVARPGPLPSDAPRASAAEQGRKGGRQKGRHLADEAKVKSSQMRKVVACWRCALQRDPVCPITYFRLVGESLLRKYIQCDPGMPCGRCTMRAQKGQTYFFDCDRSKLPDFVHDFLPRKSHRTTEFQAKTWLIIQQKPQ